MEGKEGWTMLELKWAEGLSRRRWGRLLRVLRQRHFLHSHLTDQAGGQVKRKKDTLQAAQTRARRLAKKLAAEEAACARMRDAKDAEIARLRQALGKKPHDPSPPLMGLPYLAPQDDGALLNTFAQSQPASGDFVHFDTKRAEEAERKLSEMRMQQIHAQANIHATLDKMNAAISAALAALRNVSHGD